MIKQATPVLVETPAVDAPVDLASSTYSGVVDIFECVKMIPALFDEIRTLRANTDALALEVAAIPAAVAALFETISNRDLHTVASIFAEVKAREASESPPVASGDGPADVRQRAIPGEDRNTLETSHAAGYADVGVTEAGSHGHLVRRAMRETDPVAFLVRLIAKLNGNQQPSSIRAALGGKVDEPNRAPQFAAYLARAASKSQEGRSWVGGLAWLASTPPGETFCRYSLIMRGARSADSLYAEWDASEAGR